MFTISNGNVEILHYDLCVNQNCRFVSRSQLIWVNTARFWSDHEPEQGLDGV